MKHLPTIASVLLGLLFLMASISFFAGAMPPPKENDPMIPFMAVMVPSGYMTFVKVLELVGALMMLLPKTRNWGLLLLGPIIVNIFATHLFIGKGAELANPMMILLGVLSLYALWTKRASWAALLRS
jgi:putative oxidoreductase